MEGFSLYAISPPPSATGWPLCKPDDAGNMSVFNSDLIQQGFNVPYGSQPLAIRYRDKLSKPSLR